MDRQSDGSNRTQLTNVEAGCGGPSYSPDGSDIIFHCPDGGGGFIWRMNADGSNPGIFDEIPGPNVAHADWVGP